MEPIKELLDRLNAVDESTNIEAKRGGAIHKSIMETVCSFCNEPGLGGGYILLGVERDESTLFPEYTVTGISDPDKLQLDLSTQSASMFNLPVRPIVEVEKLPNGKLVMKVYIEELPVAQKPLYFKSEGLPSGAYRRIGSSDQRCTDDDLYVFYDKEDSLDSSIIKGSTLEDISEEAVNLYRKLRERVNPLAEELTYSDIELLIALGCVKKDNGNWVLTYTGLLVFGKKMALRRLLPMVRVDYIRVPGNEWVKDPENRFTTVDMRGSLIELVQRTFNSIADDLPKGFILADNQLQAESVGLPSKVLREAIVNAFIHRTYRENQPIQIIRYGNRIEIKNPGFSLKPEEQLGEPGSKNRNPFIAAIFHETNLAETKGSGIRTMRRLMEQANMVPPTFESDHTNNTFTTRLLLHHFLSEDDIEWLHQFQVYGLNDSQKRALIFVREAGVIDNPIYRQLNGYDSLKASGELRQMRDLGIFSQKGKSRATYYVPDNGFMQPSLSAPVPDLSAPVPDLSAPVPDLSAPVPDLSAPVDEAETPVDESLVHQLPLDIQERITRLGKRATNKQDFEHIIEDICQWQPMKISKLSSMLGRSDKYLLKEFITPMRELGKLEYIYPDMPNHPEQAYKTTTNKS
jgi:ATP-dependent DNA helicase RecG